MKASSVLILIATVFMITLNALATILPFNGVSTAQVSDEYNTLFTPAGYIFAIWGLIYILLIAFSIYSFTNIGQKVISEKKFMFLYLLSSLANGVWLILWHYRIIWASVIVMLVLLISLISISLILQKKKPKNLQEKLTLYLPFSVYLGWISVATIANISSFLVSLGWNGGMTPLIWTIILLTVAYSLAVINVWRNRDLAYGLVIVWASVGIAVKNSSVQALTLAVVVLFVIFMVTSIYKLLLNKHSHNFTQT